MACIFLFHGRLSAAGVRALVFCFQVVDSDKYEVIYVSPRNYFVFTPMLAAASVGTVDVRSITEPIRMANPCVKYVSGEVIEVVPGEKKVPHSYNTL